MGSISLVAMPLFHTGGMGWLLVGLTSGPREHLLRAAGKPYPWIELQIIDPATGERLESNEIGEVRVRGSSVTPGYFANPDETDQAFADDGWLYTGDGGYLDEDGYLFLTDRLKDMIVTGAENVYPAVQEGPPRAVQRLTLFQTPSERPTISFMISVVPP